MQDPTDAQLDSAQLALEAIRTATTQDLIDKTSLVCMRAAFHQGPFDSSIQDLVAKCNLHLSKHRESKRRKQELVDMHNLAQALQATLTELISELRTAVCTFIKLQAALPQCLDPIQRFCTHNDATRFKSCPSNP